MRFEKKRGRTQIPRSPWSWVLLVAMAWALALSTESLAAEGSLVKDINTAGAGSDPGELTAVGDRVFFWVSPQSQELWVSDGTEAGTFMFYEIATETVIFGPADLALVGDRLFFTANDSEHGHELWFVDVDSGAEGGFRRGDADSSGAINLTDPVVLLNYLFLGDEPPPCRDAADVDDTGGLNITDAIYNLSFQFLGGSEPPPPFPSCGIDPTIDGLDCASYPPCQ
jgi:ELWxxDGT repeat protein